MEIQKEQNVDLTGVEQHGFKSLKIFTFTGYELYKGSLSLRYWAFSH